MSGLSLNLAIGEKGRSGGRAAQFAAGNAISPVLELRSNLPATELAPAETWLGRQVGLIMFMDRGATWETFQSEALEELVHYAPYLAARRVQVALGMPHGGSVTMQDVLDGDGDAAWQTIATAIVALQPDAIIRLWWEFNGDWYAWNEDDATSVVWIAAWRRVHGLMKAIGPGLRFEWCPNLVLTNDPENSYPGDDYVDIISGNVYHRTVAGDGTDPVTSFSVKRSGSTSARGYTWLASFAATHEKPVGMPELGIDHDHFEYYVAAVHQYAINSDVLHIGYWDQNNSVGNPESTFYEDKLSGGQYPFTGTEFQRLFGRITLVTPPAHSAGAAHETRIALVASRHNVTWSLLSAFDGDISIDGNALVIPSGKTAGRSGLVRVLATDSFGETAAFWITVTIVAGSLPLWTPAALNPTNGMLHDMQATASLTITSNAVQQINDGFGFGHTAVQGTAANRPAYSTTARDNLPGATFDGTNDVLSIASATTIPVGEYTEWVVGWLDLAATGFDYLVGVADSASAIISRIGSSGVLRVFSSLQYGSGPINESFAAEPIPPGDDFIVIVAADAPVAPGDRHLHEICRDGKRMLPHSIVSATVTPTQARIGGRPNTTGTADYWQGGFRERGRIDRKITPYERVLLQGHLAHKWAGASRLPATHACKDAAPYLTAA